MTATGPATRVRRGLTACAALAALGGCMSLDVTDPNNLSIETVFTNPSNAEAALVGSFKAYTELARGSCPTIPLEIYGNIQSSTSTTYLEYSIEPRQPINNRDNLNCLSRYIFNTSYEAAAGAREAFIGIKQNNLKYGTISTQFPDGRDTPSRKIFARFVIGISQLKLALLMDQAYLTDTITPGYNQIVQELTPWPAVLDNARQQLRAAITEARNTPDFTLPLLFVNNVANRAINRDELVRVMQSFLVRADVYSARTPQQRAAVNWAAVLARLDSTITRDFGYVADPAVAGTGSTYITNSFAQNTLRLSNRFIGPADTSGQYQAWLARPVAQRNAFVMATPDLRIRNATTPAPTVPTPAPIRIQRVTTTMGSAANAPYITSFYRHVRFLNVAADSGSRTFVPVITVQEMQFIRAEALFRLGRFADAAAIINPSRVAAGLRPVGPTGPPAGRDCVPRKDDGSCGDLFDAIMYEKRMELFPLEGDINYLDQRGWGRLLPGTPLHIPVNGRELITRGFPFYTFGGTDDRQNSAQLPNAQQP
ncbi:hypothetical protein [Gemmatimonas sp.]|uniref:hypothetical protein n=2 Tax=Gemmatimonas sp. TaxID=1962908 RepID=UPI0025BC251A|nr:hypothetical protein [Gemmatimonas sp.]MCA2983136.1 hypothetical protein [Gemmatimonas sp.]MCA2986147.1 hypothetical protein [Gemmatimonas sp.]MCA2993742.1 hypothetical protein [Gemmatimonas sp.]